MNTGSQTIAVDTCPTWCTSTEQEHDDELFGPHHYGPEFGSVQTKLSEEGTAIAFVHVEADAVDVERLRQLSADLLAAAEWLEAQA